MKNSKEIKKIESDLFLLKLGAGLFLSKKLSSLFKQPVYSFDTAIIDFSYILPLSKNISIFEFIELIRRHTSNIKAVILCDSMIWQIEDIYGVDLQCKLEGFKK